MSFCKSLKDALISANFFISVAAGVFLLFGPVAEFLWLGIINGLRLDYTYLFNTAQDSGSFIIFAPLHRGHQRDIVANPHNKRNCSAAQTTQTIPQPIIRTLFTERRPFSIYKYSIDIRQTRNRMA